MRRQESKTTTDLDSLVLNAQSRYLERCAPGYRTWRARWFGGTTQIIELGAGPPLLLVHGGMGEAFQWGPILSSLAQRHRVLAVDRPGHGLADPFDYRGIDLLSHARQFLGDIIKVINISSLPIVANSMGGLWSVSFALSEPDRVQRLVLVGAPAGIKRAQPPMALRLGTLPVLKWIAHSLMRRPTRNGVRNFWKQILVAHPERLEDDFLDLTVASQARNVASWITLIERTIDSGGLKPEFVLGERWQQVMVPTTMVWGEKDAFGMLEDAEAIAASNANIRVVRIPDAGHAPWFDQPEQVVKAIESALDAT